jgi:2,5-diamino-6-(ribosylamino)-4(3H)-pyrimidinone 5'-phosphate reductase
MHVHVNAATSADGKLSSRRREQVRISGPADGERVDALRADRDAVMVGVGTVLADDPHLTIKDDDRRAARRERGVPSNPARVVADSRARAPPGSRVLDDAATTYVLVGDDAPERRREALSDASARVVADDRERKGDGPDSSRVVLPHALDALEAEGVESMLIEGGGELLYSVFAAGLVDELSVFVGSILVGGRDAPTLLDGEGFVGEFPELTLESVERIDDGVVLSYTL